jgi:hypothetical protein
VNVGLFSRAAGIAVLALMLVAGSFLIVMPEQAGAALGLTAMDVTDGNTAADGGTDWLSPAPNISVIDDTEYTGASGAVIDDPANVLTVCDAGAGDATTLKGEIADNPPLFTSSPPPPTDKANLCQTYTAYEVVNGQVIFYFGATKVAPSGDTSMFVELTQNGIVPNTQYRSVGDVLLEFNYGGQALTEVRAWIWDGSVWNLATPGAYEGSVSANNLFFEAAVNLTSFGIFPPATSPDECLDLANILAIGKVGNGLPAALKDYTGPGGIAISNCGTLTVEKATDPVDGAGPFSFVVTSADFPTWSATGVLPADGSTESFDLLPGSGVDLLELLVYLRRLGHGPCWRGRRGYRSQWHGHLHHHQRATGDLGGQDCQPDQRPRDWRKCDLHVRRLKYWSRGRHVELTVRLRVRRSERSGDVLRAAGVGDR